MLNILERRLWKQFHLRMNDIPTAYQYLRNKLRGNPFLDQRVAQHASVEQTNHASQVKSSA